MTDHPAPSTGGGAGLAVGRRFSHRAMACIFEVLAAGPDERIARDAAEAAFEELDRLERLLSRFHPYGDVGRINAAQVGEPVVVDLETEACLLLAQRLCRQTGGAFDVTAGAGEGAVHGGRGGADLPATTATIATIAIDAEAHTVRRLAAGTRVDLGGIGKGFALDRMGQLLRDWGVGDALLHSGTSTVLAMGSAPGAAPWRVLLRDPADDRAAALGHVLLKDRAFSGSATVHAPHIIDPRSGQAVAGNRAAWAVADSAAEADALTTAMCVMDFREVREYARGRPELSCAVGVREASAWRLVRLGPDIAPAEGRGWQAGEPW